MREEFHAGRIDGSMVYRRLYGWGTINASVWLPSLCELVGYNPSTYSDVRGCYASAMQDIPNVTTTDDHYNVDKNGGDQWGWLVPFNPSGGAAEIWRLCGNAVSWLRTPDKANTTGVWVVTCSTTISWNQPVTASYAVLVGANSISLASP